MERATPPRTLAQAGLVAARAVVSEAVAFTLAVCLRARCAPAHCARGRNAMCARTARCTRACARCRCGIDRSLAPAPRRPMANTGWVYGGCRERAQALLQPDPALGCSKGLHVGWDVVARPNPVPSDLTVIASGCCCIGCLPDRQWVPSPLSGRMWVYTCTGCGFTLRHSARLVNQVGALHGCATRALWPDQIESLLMHAVPAVARVFTDVVATHSALPVILCIIQ